MHLPLLHLPPQLLLSQFLRVSPCRKPLPIRHHPQEALERTLRASSKSYRSYQRYEVVLQVYIRQHLQYLPFCLYRPNLRVPKLYLLRPLHIQPQIVHTLLVGFNNQKGCRSFPIMHLSNYSLRTWHPLPAPGIRQHPLEPHLQCYRLVQPASLLRRLMLLLLLLLVTLPLHLLRHRYQHRPNTQPLPRLQDLVCPLLLERPVRLHMPISRSRNTPHSPFAPSLISQVLRQEVPDMDRPRVWIPLLGAEVSSQSTEYLYIRWDLGAMHQQVWPVDFTVRRPRPQ